MKNDDYIFLPEMGLLNVQAVRQAMRRVRLQKKKGRAGVAAAAVVVGGKRQRARRRRVIMFESEEQDRRSGNDSTSVIVAGMLECTSKEPEGGVVTPYEDVSSFAVLENVRSKEALMCEAIPGTSRDDVPFIMPVPISGTPRSQRSTQSACIVRDTSVEPSSMEATVKEVKRRKAKGKTIRTTSTTTTDVSISDFTPISPTSRSRRSNETPRNERDMSVGRSSMAATVITEISKKKTTMTEDVSMSEFTPMSLTSRSRRSIEIGSLENDMSVECSSRDATVVKVTKKRNRKGKTNTPTSSRRLSARLRLLKQEEMDIRSISSIDSRLIEKKRKISRVASVVSVRNGVSDTKSSKRGKVSVRSVQVWTVAHNEAIVTRAIETYVVNMKTWTCLRDDRHDLFSNINANSVRERFSWRLDWAVSNLT